MSARILVVDDTPANVKLLVDVLAAKGYTMSSAAGGEQALALTRRFVELHGGRLWLDSEPGRGSTFTFTLPSQS